MLGDILGVFGPFCVVLDASQALWAPLGVLMARVGVSGFLGSLRGSAQGLVMAQYMFEIRGALP